MILGLVGLLGLGCERGEQPAAGAVERAGAGLAAEDWTRLCEAGWSDRAGERLGLWVSVARQQLACIKNGRIECRYACSTAAKGTGNREGSHQTPLGWHAVRQRYGDGLPTGAVFHERKYTGKVWAPDRRTGKDLILSRILWLAGLEPDLNAGKGIDSHARYIYIHGTPAEDKLGTPASMGCIRLSNRDVVELFGRVETGTPVLITRW